MSSYSHMGFAIILQSKVRKWLMNKKILYSKYVLGLVYGGFVFIFLFG